MNIMTDESNLAAATGKSGYAEDAAEGSGGGGGGYMWTIEVIEDRGKIVRGMSSLRVAWGTLFQYEGGAYNTADLAPGVATQENLGKTVPGGVVFLVHVAAVRRVASKPYGAALVVGLYVGYFVVD